MYIVYQYYYVYNVGPPSIHSPNEEEEEEEEIMLSKKMKLDPNHDLFADLQNGEEYGFKLSGNDDFEEGQETDKKDNFVENQQEEEEEHHHNNIEPVVLYRKGSLDGSKGESDLPPPPIPPRSHSLSPSPNQPLFHDHLFGGRVDIYGDNSHVEELSGSNNGSTRPFLGQGRGGDTASPPLPINHTENARSTAATSPEENIPPPLPAKQSRRRQVGAYSPPSQHLQDIKEEEQALLSILDELERSVSRTPEALIEKNKEEVPVVSRTAKEVEQVSGGSSEEKL